VSVLSKIQDLKKEFFISKEEFEKELLPSYIEKILKFCKIDIDGTVLFGKIKITSSDKIKIILIARFLANKLDSKVNNIVGLNEIVAITGVQKNIVAARLKELLDRKIIYRESTGNYSIYPHQINNILETLVRKYEK